MQDYFLKANSTAEREAGLELGAFNLTTLPHVTYCLAQSVPADHINQGQKPRVDRLEMSLRETSVLTLPN